MKLGTYFDHNATTPLLPEVKQWIHECVEQGFGNPSSIHWAGRLPKQYLREARLEVARWLNVQALDVIFTSGATESNNAILQSWLREATPQRRTIISSNIEHPSVMRFLDRAHSLGLCHWVQVPVTVDGGWDPLFYQQQLGPHVIGVSVMAANNETGYVFPLADIVRSAHSVGARVHSDITQALGKISVDLKQWDLDYASFSAHKVYALKGCGGVVVRNRAFFEPGLWGGAQERYRRAGTENVLGIGALGLALKVLPSLDFMQQHLLTLRDYFEYHLLQGYPAAKITQGHLERLPNTSHVVLPGVDGESLLIRLDLEGYAVSTGAACSSGSPEPSPVLLNLGLSREQAQNSLRVSFGLGNTLEQVQTFTATVVSVARHLSQMQKDKNYE